MKNEYFKIKTRPITISCVLRANSDGLTNGPTNGPTNRLTNRPTNRPTNKAAYRVACMQLIKMWIYLSNILEPNPKKKYALTSTNHS